MKHSKLHFNGAQYRALVKSFARIRVVVVGDVMLDTFTYGTSVRNSPEAPVPVVDVTHDVHMPGGAANAALNAAALGATVSLFGFVGTDSQSEQIASLLADTLTTRFIRVPAYQTTHKQRIVFNNAHAIRIDREVRRLSREVRKNLCVQVRAALADADVLIIADYAKGALESADIRALIRSAKRAHVPVVIDTKPVHIAACVGATLLTPNCAEVRAMTGIASCSKAGTTLARRLGGAVLVTAGARGMYACTERAVSTYPAYAASVQDVSGAGDTVTAAAALAIATGAQVDDAAHIASAAAAVVVAKRGTAHVTRAELMRALSVHAPQTT